MNPPCLAGIASALLATSVTFAGAEPVPVAKATPASLGALLKSEVDKWAPIIRKSGVYAD